MQTCKLCYHHCAVDRARVKGRCALDEKLYVAHLGKHMGEEPALGGENGVCNVFFAHCNLRCQFCQNFQISAHSANLTHTIQNFEEILEKIIAVLQTGCTALGLVSPTPYIPYIPPLVEAIHQRGFYPTVIYNTNAYDTPQALDLLKGCVDVYLPDYKYSNDELARRLSAAPNYPELALNAIDAMIQQVGKELQYTPDGRVTKGVIIRHLVLPNHIENSRAALFNLWTEFGNKLTISLMSQYTPLYAAQKDPLLNRKITPEEYQEVVDFMYALGFTNGWYQDLESGDCYIPNFDLDSPFA